MQRAVWIFVVGVLLSCSENEQATQDLNLYFDLDSVLDQQIQFLSEEGYQVSKSVTMDRETEKKMMTPDSSGWAAEFVIIRDFDLNKPYNVGAYSEDRESGAYTYRLTDQTLDAPVRYFTVKERGNTMTITSDYYEDKSIYQHRRKLRLTLKDKVLSSYEVKGFQKMIMKDTIHYRIGGEVSIQ